MKTYTLQDHFLHQGFVRDLVSSVHEDPVGFFAAHEGRFLNGLLVARWRGLAVAFETAPGKPPLGQPMEVNGRRALLIRMPPPFEPTQAYFVAVVLEGESARVFALELGFDGTVLCAWTPTSHVNFGRGPEPEETAFTAAVGRLL
jgi:hypothetical protein